MLSLVACRGESVDSVDAGAGQESGSDSGTDDATDIDTSADADATADTTLSDSGSAPDTSTDSMPADSAKADAVIEAGVGDALVLTPKSQADCPIARGPKMAFLAAPSPYCIDETEVTNAQINVFLAASDKPTAPVIPAYCVGKLSLSAPYSTSHPAVWVRWCHAYAYCKWAGKRLCGKHGGGTYAWADSEASYNSQWSYACRGGIPGTQYPYGGGSAYTKDVCVGGEPTFTAVVPVDDPLYSGCHGAGEFATLMHMAGNAREWEDSCDNTGPIDEFTSCRTRGGAWSSPYNEVNCGSALRNITNADSTVGFRCCYDGT